MHTLDVASDRALLEEGTLHFLLGQNHLLSSSSESLSISAQAAPYVMKIATSFSARFQVFYVKQKCLVFVYLFKTQTSHIKGPTQSTDFTSL